MSENLWLLPTTSSANAQHWVVLNPIVPGRQQDAIVLDSDPDRLVFADTEACLQQQLATKIQCEEEIGGLKIRKVVVTATGDRLTVRIAGERAGQVDLPVIARMPGGMDRLADLVHADFKLCIAESEASWTDDLRKMFWKAGLVTDYVYDSGGGYPRSYIIQYDKDRARSELNRLRQAERYQRAKSSGQLKKKFPTPSVAGKPIQGYKVHSLVSELKGVLESLGFWATARQITGGTTYARAEIVAVELVSILSRLIGVDRVKRLPALIWFRWAEWPESPDQNADRLPRLNELFKTLSPSRVMRKLSFPPLSIADGKKREDIQLRPTYRQQYQTYRKSRELPRDLKQPLEKRLRLNLAHPNAAVDTWIALTRYPSCHVAISKPATPGTAATWYFLPIGRGLAPKNKEDLDLAAVDRYVPLEYVGVVTRAALKRVTIATRLEAEAATKK